MLTIGTRFFEGKSENAPKALARLSKFVEAARELGKVFVAINVADDKADTLAFCNDKYPDVDAFAVSPWGKFVPPLNAIVYRAALSGSDRLLLASAEFAPTATQVDALLAHVDDATVVAGARFPEHQFTEGNVVGTGSTTPWNTFAVWNMMYLARFGFPLVGDAAFNQKMAGVEEVAAAALYQKLYGLSAKLVSVAGFYEQWNTDGWDADRLAAHQAKIASKVSRPAAQLEWASLAAPNVLHIA